MAEKKITKNDEYGNHSIVSLKDEDRVRKRPSVIFGSDGLEGCEHSVFEIVSNAVDEARAGFGNTITVSVFGDGSIEVDDKGRGIPLGWNEKEKRYNWDLIFCELYAGGKFDNNSGSSSYEYSLGLNGLGDCATQYCSEYMDVKSYSGGKLSEIHFRKGKVRGKLTETELPPRERRTGTVIRWKPDLEVFTDTNIPHEYFTDMLKRQAVVNPGVKFVLYFNGAHEKGEAEEFLYENGIADRVGELCGDASLTETVFWKTETSGRDRDDKKDYKLRIEAAFCFSKTVSTLEYYHNSSYLEHGGSPDKAVRLAFPYAIDKYIKSTGKYRKGEAKITFVDVADALVLVSSSFSTQTSYENQTKKSITNTFIADAMTDFFKKQLDIYFTERPAEAEKIANQVLINKRSRESAESTRVDVIKKLTAATSDSALHIDKFVGCRSKDIERRELYIVEGDSALTSTKLARNAEFQAVIAVRGKTLNCLKANYDRIFKSEIIVNLLKVIGCGAELPPKIKGSVSRFSLESLRWSKIIICTDADEDGFQIRTLILTLFYRLLPTLITEGKVYIAETPLFEITTKDETYFAFDEFEKAELLKSLEGKKYTLQRSKGLGENDPDMMSRTTMKPQSRRLIKITPTDAAATAEMFDTLLGDDLESRKDFIAANGSKYVKDADI